MSGTDTSRGINFQYAIDIEYFLEFVGNENWELIQLEGDIDIEDVTIFDKNSNIILRSQIKQKQDPYRWEPNEIKSVLNDFADCVDTKDIIYQFVYAGAEGDTLVKKIKPILSRLQNEPMADLTTELNTLRTSLGDKAVDFLLKVTNRVSLIKKDGWESSEAIVLRKLRKVLSQNLKSSLECDYEEIVYNDIFTKVAKGTEKANKYQRQFSREKVFQLLRLVERKKQSQQSANLEQYIHTLKKFSTNRASSIFHALQPTSALPNILTYVAQVENFNTEIRNDYLQRVSEADSFSIFDLIKKHNSALLIGESGIGKTVSLWQLILQLCDDYIAHQNKDNFTQIIPVYINLSNTVEDSVDALIIQAFYYMGQIINSDEINLLSSQGALLILFDNFDFCDESLANKIKSWRFTNPRCNILVTTQRVSDGYYLQLPTFQLKPFNDDQAARMLMTIPGINDQYSFIILNTLENELDYLTTSPLTLQMLAYVFLQSNHQIPRSRSTIFEEVIKGIFVVNEAKGFTKFLRSDKELLLSLLAQWMQNENTFIISASKLTRLLTSWINSNDADNQVSHLKHSDILSLRKELLSCGILQQSIDGDYDFIHPSFQAYFGALTIQPTQILELISKSGWELSLVFYSSLCLDNNHLAQLIQASLSKLVLLGKITQERRYELDLGVNFQNREYIEQFVFLVKSIFKQFNFLKKSDPWKALQFEHLSAKIVESPEAGFVIVWDPIQNKNENIVWLKPEKLTRFVEETKPSVWLISAKDQKKFHPLELAYYWLIRILYELFENTKSKTSSINTNTDPKSANLILLEMFTEYKNLVRDFPLDIVEKLPFYANKGLDIRIEIDNTSNPVTIKYGYGLLENTSEIKASINFINEKDNSNFWFSRETSSQLDYIGGDNFQMIYGTMTDLDSILQSDVAQGALMNLEDDLKRALPAFPPQVW